MTTAYIMWLKNHVGVLGFSRFFFLELKQVKELGGYFFEL